jgi:hypothetical protein
VLRNEVELSEEFDGVKIAKIFFQKEKPTSPPPPPPGFGLEDVEVVVAFVVEPVSALPLPPPPMSPPPIVVVPPFIDSYCGVKLNPPLPRDAKKNGWPVAEAPDE